MTWDLIRENLNLSMLYSFLLAGFVSMLIIPPIVRMAKLKKLFAEPNGRTSHNGNIPYLGGIAIFASLAISTSLFADIGTPDEFQFIIPALLIIFFIGLKDDVVCINPLYKLGAQVLTSLIVIMLADLRIRSMYGVFGVYELPYIISVVLTLFVFVSLINAFNLIDGIDGLASGLGIQISMIFGLWLGFLHQYSFSILAFSLAGSLIPFYFYNVLGGKNKLFMGDTGSLLIGLIIIILAIKIIHSKVPEGSVGMFRARPAVIVSAMIIPIADILRIFAFRIVRGKSPFGADKNHFHHYLLRLGMGHWQASTTIIAINILIFVLAVILRHWGNMELGLLILSLGIIITMVPGIILRLRRKT